MGKALHQALGEKAGIKRFGWASVPLDETLAQVTVDLSGRPCLVYNVTLPDRKSKRSTWACLRIFSGVRDPRGLNLHVNLQYGRNPHHIMEAISGVGAGVGSGHHGGRAIVGDGPLDQGQSLAGSGAARVPPSRGVQGFIGPRRKQS